MTPVLATRTAGVLGSGTDEHDDVARDVGELLARLEVNLLTGGGPGVMTSVSRAFVRSRRGRGICIGIIPCRSESERDVPKEGYPNEFVELPIYTHLPYSGTRGKDDLSRNHINVLSSDALIVLPGSHGTASEAALAIDYRKPVIAYSRDLQLMRDLPEQIKRVTTILEVEEFLRPVVERGTGRRKT